MSEFLRHIPNDSGYAFVFIQHLDPSHESILTEILSRTARIPVEEVHEGVLILQNHAYIIPPNVEMSIKKGVLHLAPRRPHPGINLPVDHFFQSLAADRGRRSIGVVLSGTGSDGSTGCKAIKEAGGIVFAQSEAGAKFSGMPRNAIGAGCVDFVLSPKEIAEKLLQIAARPYVAGEQKLGSSTDFSERNLREMFDILVQRVGVDFSQYKPNTLQRRIRRRMALHKYSRLTDYIDYLRDVPKEAHELYLDILITVTSFFREPDAFESLKKTVFRPLLAARPPDLPCESGCRVAPPAKKRIPSL
jgi:two-component system CheB/CheR fusion protein